MNKSDSLRLALMAMEEGKDSLALATLENAERTLGLDNDFAYAKGLVLIRMTRTDEARKNLEGILKTNPKHNAALETLASLIPQSSINSATSPSLSWQPTSGPVSQNRSLSKKIMKSPYGVIAPNPLSIVNYATSNLLWDEVLAFHHELATDDYVRGLDGFYRECKKRYGSHWHYLDVVNTLYAGAKWIQPANYLEIGVRRGRTACTVARAFPDVNIHAFDMWIEGYAGMENPGPDFVRAELKRNGHKGNIQFTDGDSHRTVPAYFNAHPELRLDLILVDGDHSEQGALEDLNTVIPKLNPGGMVVFDDIAHPGHKYLQKVWRRAMEQNSDCVAYEFTEAGYGVAFAVKKG